MLKQKYLARMWKFNNILSLYVHRNFKQFYEIFVLDFEKADLKKINAWNLTFQQG